MNTGNPVPPNNDPTGHHVEFFRLPASGKRDPYFGLSRGWYFYKAAAGEIRMVAVRQRNALRGVTLVVLRFGGSLHPAVDGRICRRRVINTVPESRGLVTCAGVAAA